MVVQPVQQDGGIRAELKQRFDRGRVDDCLGTFEVLRPLT